MSYIYTFEVLNSSDMILNHNAHLVNQINCNVMTSTRTNKKKNELTFQVANL